MHVRVYVCVQTTETQIDKVISSSIVCSSGAVKIRQIVRQQGRQAQAAV